MMKVLGEEVSRTTSVHPAYVKRLTESLIDLRDLIDVQLSSEESRKYEESWEVIAAECAAFTAKVKFYKI